MIYQIEHRDVDVWVHPEVRPPSEWTDHGDRVGIDCPNPPCSITKGGFYVVDDDPDATTEKFDDDLIGFLESHGGEYRCRECAMKLLAIRRGGTSE